jgi:UDP-N-acetylmuramoylalanine--D-glutamate ligase
MNAILTNKEEMTEAKEQFDSIVVGLGKTGISAIEYLLSQGERIAAADSRLQPPDIESIRRRFPHLHLYLGDFEKSNFYDCERLLLSPGVSIREPAIQAAIKKGVHLSSDVEVFCQQVKAPIVAVTGSNGKSTVVTLLTDMIERCAYRVKLAGNIGTPVLDLVGDEEPDFYVLELSSFQLETLQSLNAVAALVLNVSADHMDRYQCLEDYASVKQVIYAGDGKMILNADDPLVSKMEQSNRESVHYGLSDSAGNEFGIRVVDGEILLCHRQENLMSTSSLKILGRHNISNVLATLALGDAIGLPMQTMLESLRDFSGLAHRCQWVAKVNEVDWYNDSKGTNVGASCAAIESLSGGHQLILIAGGESKQADFYEFSNSIQAHVSQVILIGRDAALIDEVLSKGTQRYFATGMQAAVNTAAKLAKPGDIVLLSPACASQDMYRDYQERGDQFTEAVLALSEARS